MKNDKTYIGVENNEKAIDISKCSIIIVDMCTK